MNYQISEKEFCSLEDVRDQLGFVLGLLVGNPTGATLDAITCSQLLAFIDAQQRSLGSIITAAEEREQAQREQRSKGGSMSWVDWMHALRIARGEGRFVPSGTAHRITEKLAGAAGLDDAMGFLLKEWTDTLAAQAPASAPAQPVTKRRRREKLVQEAA